jgi:hypothetical protein
VVYFLQAKTGGEKDVYATMCQPVSDQRGFSAPAAHLQDETRDLIQDSGRSCEYWLTRAEFYRSQGMLARAAECQADAESNAYRAFALAEGRA